MKRIRHLFMALLTLMSITNLSVAATISESLSNEPLTVYIFDEHGFMDVLKQKGFAFSHHHNDLSHYVYSKNNGPVVTLTQTVSEGMVDHYQISRPWSAKQADMDSSEAYQLVVFTNPESSFRDEQLQLEKHSGSWFASTPKASVDTLKTQVVVNGLLSTLNLKNSNTSNPYQVMEMLSAVARQAPLLKALDHPNIIKPAVARAGTNELALVAVPDNNYYDKMLSRSVSLQQLTRDMAQVANAMNYLHELEVAHGDIKLASVQLHQDKPVLSQFERFSLLDRESRAQQIGTKKFLFYNNEFHAPELRYPNGPEKTWQYTYATKAGDVWSFGMMLAAALYAMPVAHDAVKATALGSKKVYQQLGMSQEWAQGRFDNKQDRQVFRQSLAFHFRKTSVVAEAPSSAQSAIITQFIQLIEDCTRADPKARPSAREVSERVLQLVVAVEKVVVQPH